MPKKQERPVTAEIILFPGPLNINFLTLDEVITQKIPVSLNAYLSSRKSETPAYTTIDCCGRVQQVFSFDSRCNVCDKVLLTKD